MSEKTKKCRRENGCCGGCSANILGQQCPIHGCLCETGSAEKSPFTDPKGRMPRWIEIEAELGFWSYELKQAAKKMPKSALHKMIDDSTGFTDSLEAAAVGAAQKIVELKRELEKETGIEQDTEIEERIIAICDR